MVRKKILIALLGILVGIILVIVLYILSDKPNTRRNGFTRKFQHISLKGYKTLDLLEPGFHIAGLDSPHIFFANLDSSYQVLDVQYENLNKRKINPTTTATRSGKAFDIHVENSTIYMTQINSDIIQTNSLQNLNPYNYYLNNLFFTLALPVSKNSFILRGYDPSLKTNILIKKTFSPASLKLAPVLEKQYDGFFCTEGLLLYNKQAARIFYLYAYRNQFICLDTNLNVLYKAKTIDTTSKAKIKLTEIKSTKSIVLASRPLVVNTKACSYGNTLYINSTLIADNEKKETFARSSVIDLYDAENGNYRSSFYVPDLGDIKMTDFYVKGNLIFILYGNVLKIFTIEDK